MDFSAKRSGFLYKSRFGEGEVEVICFWCNECVCVLKRSPERFFWSECLQKPMTCANNNIIVLGLFFLVLFETGVQRRKELSTCPFLLPCDVNHAAPACRGELRFRSGVPRHGGTSVASVRLSVPKVVAGSRDNSPESGHLQILCLTARWAACEICTETLREVLCC